MNDPVHGVRHFANLCIKIRKVLGKTLDELFWTEE